jgi:S-(hydroxymethyl)glutathione dehydrogenase / alcohol dehydrogenase
VQFAQLAGAHPIVAVDLLAHKLAMAKARGATHCIDASKTTDVDGEIRKIVGPKGPDKVLETTGVKSVIELAYELTHPDGTCVLVGVPSEKVTIYTLPMHFNKVLTGSHGGDAVPHVDIPRIIRLARAGRISFEGIITHEFPLDEINTALDLVRSGTAGRVLLNVAS